MDAGEPGIHIVGSSTYEVPRRMQVGNLCCLRRNLHVVTFRKSDDGAAGVDSRTHSGSRILKDQALPWF